ncbi:MAG TPA: glycogen debranching N-terminal domain-containing protein [Thermomicrobiales bacterium]|nr:glycogen debranching N-terminal domain-containing protein [Thermomicrobiales bacterium]
MGTATKRQGEQGQEQQGGGGPDEDDSSGQQQSSQARQHEARILNQGQSSTTSDIGATLTLKEGTVFLLTDQRGGIPPQARPHRDRGLGLYFHDMRHLDQATLRVNGAPMTLLLATSDLGYQGVCELTNPDFDLGDGRTLQKERVGVRWEKRIRERVEEHLTLQNFDKDAVDLTLTLEYDAHFDSIFTIRGAEPGARGTLQPPAADDQTLTFAYDGADGHHRTTTLAFDPRPDAIADRRVTYRCHLEPNSSCTYQVTIAVADEAPSGRQRTLEAQPPTASRQTRQAQRHADEGSVSGKVQVETSNVLFNKVLRRSFLDLAMLSMVQGGDRFYAGGVPWYVALFGRDSLVTAHEMLAYDPRIARNTLEILAKYQGTKVDDERDEEPGKILHELRVGEKANLHEVPSTPYYGTIDATPLFLILLGDYLLWTADLDFFKRMEGHVEAALRWMDDYGDKDGDGFLAYASKSSKGLANQGWKDSGNSIINADGSLVTPPVALVEVQGYAYRARRAIAGAYRHAGDADRAAALDQAADQLREKFNAQFWLPDLKNYALALQKDKRPAAVDASNQGQALWGGIVDPAKAGRVRDTLMDPSKLFAGWGIRTLSNAALAYNPFDYQVGAVWPQDNALVLAGLRAYGFDQEALDVFSGIYQAATHFDYYRLPELFAGFGQDQYPTPVHYPVACSPQAWAAGSIPFMLHALLGLSPDAFGKRLEILRPVLPDWLDWVVVRGLDVGGASVDLKYQRADGTTLVAVLHKEGELQVAIEY